jgi:DNA repair protein RecO (recombination protein O)
VTLYRDHGIVLRTYKLGEADRIVVLMTRDHGKVRAVAKGVRKTKSRFGARLEPLSHVALLLYHGRGELDIVSQAEAVDSFRPIREDLDRLGRSGGLLEAVDQLAREGEADVRLYQMLLGALRALAAHDSAVLVGAFYWKLLSHEGLQPVLDSCVVCASPGPLVAFDSVVGGTLCASCRRGPSLSPEALDLMRRILGGQLGGVLNEDSSAAGHEVEQLATRALEHHLERRLRTAGVL